MRFSLVLALALGCSKSDPKPAPAPATTQPVVQPPAVAVAQRPTGKDDPALAKQRIADGAVVLDVRSPEEFAEGHLANATNVPVDDVHARLAEIDKLAGGDKKKPIVTYCAAGKRAGRAKQTLEAAGYTNVTNGGGYDDLRE